MSRWCPGHMTLLTLLVACSFSHKQHLDWLMGRWTFESDDVVHKQKVWKTPVCLHVSTLSFACEHLGLMGNRVFKHALSLAASGFWALVLSGFTVLGQPRSQRCCSVAAGLHLCVSILTETFGNVSVSSRILLQIIASFKGPLTNCFWKRAHLLIKIKRLSICYGWCCW